ncbi:nuclear transport factor 2 family protein [Rhodococcus chondri]|uniref:Nuclear transport factor 2 family protein n=1 Tax=Rhodococcus chondri TaxID=3065941 RepID=A0ABU7JP50_9NOCA|nr:nuclear transport factor 2 family protein [Rhodococcus sp. CC-R104]MEE2031092.1 nuclear transport factor 2 family protein [Rhodococcus sp. CC-R104]
MPGTDTDTTDSFAPAPDAIRGTVEAYLAALRSGSSAAIVALYADDATLEDPAGTAPKVGRDAIAQFYSALDGSPQKAELLTLRVSGASAAFHFRVTSPVGDHEYEVEPIDVMTFDEQARITSMRAYWSSENLRQL